MISSSNDDTTKEDDIEEAKRAIQATVMIMGMRVSIFGCLVGKPPGGRKTKSLFSVLGIGFPEAES